MAIYKRGRVYWMRFEFNGKRFERSTRLRNERDAQTYERKFRTNLAMSEIGLIPAKLAPALEKFADQFRAYVEIHNAEHPLTVRYYKRKLGELLKYKPLADARLNRIDEEMIQNYIEFRISKVSPSTVDHELTTLKRLLNIAKDEFKLITHLPKFRMLGGKSERDFVLSQDQEKAYLAVCHDTLRDFAILALDTGVRVGEGAALEWSDVCLEPAPDAKLGYIRIRKGKSKNAKRILCLTPRVKAMLEVRRAFFPEAKYVFPSPRQGRHISVTTLEGYHVTARRDARMENGDTLPEYPFVIHSLRHTFGTRFGESGADAFTIMKAMGHSSVTVSQKYVHPTPDHMERAFERFDLMNRIMRGEVETHIDASTSSSTEVTRRK